MRNVSLLVCLALLPACGGGDSASDADATAAPAAAPAASTPSNPPATTAPSADPPDLVDPDALPDYAVDDAIPTAVRDEVNGLQARLLESVRNDDSSVLQEMFAPGLLPESSQEARHFFESLRNQVVDARIEPWHAVYTEPKSTAPMFVETGGENNVRVAIPGAGPKVYVSLQQLRNEFRDGLLAAIWVQRTEGWRLVALRIGALRIDGRTALEWYEEARALADQGLALPAWLRLTVADDLLESIPFVSYPHTNDARALLTRLSNELTASNSFPMTLSQVAGEPQVVRIDPTFLQGSLSPAVHYVSQLNLQDTSLNDEAQAVSDALGALYAGFCHDASHVAVAVYNEVPTDASRQYASATFAADCP